MLSYQHGYHAGSFADVHKHAALCLLLADLARKPAPFTVIDTHAGRGRYDLGGPQARKTGEWRGGIGKLWDTKPESDGLKRLLAVVRQVNGAGDLRTYPGSPLIAARLARAGDRIEALELHPAEVTALRRAMRGLANVRVQSRDGFDAMAELVPGDGGRALALIDPSYEVKTEYAKVPAAVAAMLARAPRLCVLVWYPILAEGRHRALCAGFADLAAKGGHIIAAELTGPPPARGLIGTGLVIVNPPAGFKDAIAAAGAELADLLFGPGLGRHAIEGP